MRTVLADELGNKAIVDTNPGGLAALATPSDIKASFLTGR